MTVRNPNTILIAFTAGLPGRIRLGAEAREGAVAFWVSDTGCGIPEPAQAKLHNVAARPFVVTNAQDLLIGSN